MIAYLITNTVNGKRYVGISKHDTPDKRWILHVKDARRSKNHQILLQMAIRKYGSDVFTVEPLASAKSWEDLCALEVILIAQHKTFWQNKSGYNMTLGGEGSIGLIVSQETRDKIGASHKGKKRSPEARANLKAATARRIDEQLAWLHTPESRAKAALANTGKKRSEETRNLLGQVRLGKRHTDDAKAKMSASHKGFTPSAETREKLSIALKGRKLSDVALVSVSVRNLNTIFITDGINVKRVSKTSDIPTGWLLGMGKIWITNGITSRRVNPELPIPDGWRLGKRHSKREIHDTDVIQGSITYLEDDEIAA